MALRHCAKLYALRRARGCRRACRGGGCRAGMTGSRTEVVPCPNISPGPRRRSPKAGGGVPPQRGGGGGSGARVSPPRRAGFAWRAMAPLPDPCLYSNPPPVRPPPPCGSPQPLGVRSSVAWAETRHTGGQSGHGTCHSLRYGSSVYGTRVGVAAGPRWGRRCARLPAKTWPADCVGVVREGQAALHAWRPYTLGAPPAKGGEVMAH